MRSAAAACLRKPVTLSRTTSRSTCASAGTSMTSQCASSGHAGVAVVACRPALAARQATPAYFGSVHVWSAKAAHLRITTWVPSVAEPLGSVRHRPLSFSTYSPLDLCVQVWAAWPLQVQTTSLAPAPPWLESSRHLPRTDSSPPENVHFWDVVLLQVQMSTLLPFVVEPPKSSRHFPWSPLIGPDTAVLIVQLNDTDLFAPVSSVAATVTPNVPAVVGVPVTVPVVAPMPRPAGSPVALQESGLPAVELPTIARLTLVPTLLVWVPGLVILIVSLIAPVGTHPPAALLHCCCTANWPGAGVSVRLKSVEHLLEISLPSVGSTQPVSGNGSVIVLAYRSPPTMLHPSLSPPGVGLTASLPHFVPASSSYGRLMNGWLDALW